MPAKFKPSEKIYKRVGNFKLEKFISLTSQLSYAVTYRYIFFWGQQFQEESVQEYKEQDIKFLKFCEQSINEKKVVEYWCSW